MSELTFILADTDPATKIIFGAIFVLIWIVSSIVSGIVKKKEAEHREQVRRQLERATSTPAPAPPPLPQERPMVKQARQTRPKKAVARPARQIPAPPAAPVVARAPEPVAEVPSARRTTSAAAVALHGWLKPATLRQQFILTEVLQPPVALRESHLT